MIRKLWGLGLCLALLCGASLAQAAEERGPVTNLPLPRFVSMKAGEGNVRRGPSLTHRIDWVYTRRDMPLEITAEYGHWRRVRDREGAGGWVHYSLLSGVRTVIVEEDMLDIRSRPDVAAPVEARLRSSSSPSAASSSGSTWLTCGVILPAAYHSSSVARLPVSTSGRNDR